MVSLFNNKKKTNELLVKNNNHINDRRSFSYSQFPFNLLLLLLFILIQLSSPHKVVYEKDKYADQHVKTAVTSTGQAGEKISELHDDTYFEVTYPEDVAYSYRSRIAKNFGSYFKKQLKSVPLVISDPYKACSEIQNFKNIRGKVVLIQRGDCPFYEKVYHAEKAGAVAVLVADNDPTNQMVIEMIAEHTEKTRDLIVTIPSLFIRWKDGHMIKKSIQASETQYAILNLPLNLTLANPNQKLRGAPWLSD